VGSRSRRNANQKQLLSNEKKFEKKLYRWFIAALVVAVVYYFFIEPTTIGFDYRHDIFIFWIPIIAGIIFFGWYRREFLLTQYVTSKGFILKAFIIVFYLIQGAVISMVTFRQAAQMIWDFIQVIEAKDAPHETFEFSVTQFGRSRGKSSWAYVDFKMNGREESFYVRHSFIRDYLEEDPDVFKVRIQAQKGVWGYYLVNHWEILKK
jgi:hypothetical protein